MESNTSHVRVFLKILAFACMCLVFFIFHIWFRTKVVTKGFEVAAHRKEVAELESRLVKLRVEQNKIMGNKSLEAYVEKLDQGGDGAGPLGPPKPAQLIYVKTESLAR